MSVLAGTKLGPYEILSPLGAGGMGEVYRARDARLGRDVAVKILPSGFSADADRLRRFEQEARAAGVLNHPNILVIYDIGAHDGSPYVVSELLEGETLRDRLRGAALTARKAIEYAIQIARGLGAAHEKGIIHRDLKPENLFITRDGRIKILDFGLAKLTQPRPADTSHTQAPTVALDADDTAPGVVMGTAGYMSPEQVRGQKADHRADIFSFGAILYEMLTGKRAFQGESAIETMNSILKEEPPELRETGGVITPALERLVKHCLEKDPDDRFQSARDLAFDLETLSGISSLSAAQTVVARRPVQWKRAALSSLIGLAVMAVAAAIWFLWVKSAGPTTVRTVRLNRLTDFAGLEEFSAISPDGKSVAFTADNEGNRQIWVRLLAGGAPLQLTRNSGDHQFPRWSNDSTSLIYYSSPTEAESQGVIWEISALGGAPRRIASSITDGDLSHDGKQIAFLRFAGPVEVVVSARDGSNPRVVAQLVPGFTYRHARWSPDGKWVAFQRDRVYEDDIFVVPAAGGEPRQITHEGNLLSGYSWLPDSSGIVYSSARGATVYYLPVFNLWTVKLDGSGLKQLSFGEASYVYPDLNRTGSIVASRLRIQFDIWKYPIDGAGEENVRRGVQITRQTGQVQTPSVGPGDQELVYLSDSGGHGNLWVRKQEGGETRQITYERDPDVALGVPVWSPNGKHIAFVSTRGLGGWDFGLWLVSPDGSNVRNVAKHGGWACWSADSHWIYYAHGATSDGFYHIEKIPAEGGQPITVRTDNALGPALAPDGSALYYAVPLALVNGISDFEIRVARPEDGASTLLARIPGWRVPAGQTIHPLISPDGKWLALLLSDGAGANIWALPTSGGTMRQLTNFGQRRTFIARRVSWSSDGRFIFAALGEGDSDVVLLDGLLP